MAIDKRQVAMVMDLNKCIGCQTCTIACKTQWTSREGMEGMWWNQVNTMPGHGTPKDWQTSGGGFDAEGKPRPGKLPAQGDFGEPFQFDFQSVFYGGEPGAPLLPQDGDPSWGVNWDEDQGAGEYPNAYYFYIPRICNHCTRPACMEACPRGAIFKREEDGIVVINEDHCRGFRFCQEACPYKEIYYNALEHKSQKCLLCAPRIEQGVATACSRQCPGRVRFLGFLNDEAGPIHKLVNVYKVALPLHPEFGTQPNVFYIPPLSPPAFDKDGNPTGKPRIPLEYLESLFGDGVKHSLDTIEAERQKRRRGEPSELMDILISRRWLEMFGPFDKAPRDIEQAFR